MISVIGSPVFRSETEQVINRKDTLSRELQCGTGYKTGLAPRGGIIKGDG